MTKGHKSCGSMILAKSFGKFLKTAVRFKTKLQDFSKLNQA